MGCVSSKHFRKEFTERTLFINGDCTAHHLVSLTSSTYGLLNLEKTHQQLPPVSQKQVKVSPEKKRSPPRDEPPEVINAWELMEGLEDDEAVTAPGSVRGKRSPKFLRGFADLDTRTPIKFLNLMASPKKSKRSGGKENRGTTPSRFDNSPKVSNSRKASPNLGIPVNRSENPRIDSPGCVLSRRQSLNRPLFGPLREISGEEQIKKMVSVIPMIEKSKNSDSESLLNLYEKKCPVGGENQVIIYTTTLRGIRKTFEECNTVRSIFESHGVWVIERDVSMDSGFKEELRKVMGTKEVKVPAVFVKGRLIGGAGEVVKLEEEGKLGILLDGVPVTVPGAACKGCAGFRFVMCLECSGSSKILGQDGKRSVKCGECNENGLVQCSICC